MTLLSACDKELTMSRTLFSLSLRFQSSGGNHRKDGMSQIFKITKKLQNIFCIIKLWRLHLACILSYKISVWLWCLHLFLFIHMAVRIWGNKPQTCAAVEEAQYRKKWQSLRKSLIFHFKRTPCSFSTDNTCFKVTYFFLTINKRRRITAGGSRSLADIATCLAFEA